MTWSSTFNLSSGIGILHFHLHWKLWEKDRDRRYGIEMEKQVDLGFGIYCKISRIFLKTLFWFSHFHFLHFYDSYYLTLTLVSSSVDSLHLFSIYVHSLLTIYNCILYIVHTDVFRGWSLSLSYAVCTSMYKLGKYNGVFPGKRVTIYTRRTSTTQTNSISYNL